MHQERGNGDADRLEEEGERERKATEWSYGCVDVSGDEGAEHQREDGYSRAGPFQGVASWGEVRGAEGEEDGVS